jgi:hypothetical protein
MRVMLQLPYQPVKRSKCMMTGKTRSNDGVGAAAPFIIRHLPSDHRVNLGRTQTATPTNPLLLNRPWSGDNDNPVGVAVTASLE